MFAIPVEKASTRKRYVFKICAGHTQDDRETASAFEIYTRGMFSTCCFDATDMGFPTLFQALISHEKVHKTQSERGYVTCQVCGLHLMADVPNSLKNHMTKHTGTLDHNNYTFQ